MHVKMSKYKLTHTQAEPPSTHTITQVTTNHRVTQSPPPSLPDDGLTELLVEHRAVVLAHEAHELAVHAQDHQHLQLLVAEEGVTLCEHIVRAAQHTLAERTLH